MFEVLIVDCNALGLSFNINHVHDNVVELILQIARLEKRNRPYTTLTLFSKEGAQLSMFYFTKHYCDVESFVLSIGACTSAIITKAEDNENVYLINNAEDLFTRSIMASFVDIPEDEPSKSSLAESTEMLMNPKVGVLLKKAKKLGSKAASSIWCYCVNGSFYKCVQCTQFRGNTQRFRAFRCSNRTSIVSNQLILV